MRKILHLITQDNQPYGSVRLSCERCGAFKSMDNDYVTTIKETWLNPPQGFTNCCAETVSREGCDP